jgi:release factor glutamine methyltransferase
LSHVLDWPRARIVAEGDYPIVSSVRDTFCRLVTRRINREPVAYLIGHREFYGLELEVDRRVLVPRPETELLVEQTLALASYCTPATRPLAIADIGTGSGAIAIALAVHLPMARIVATDISPEALDVAQNNARRHGVAERIMFLEGDLLAPLSHLSHPLDIIVSNPPYTIIDEIDEGVRLHEPTLALDGGDDGLSAYRRLIAAMPRWLRPGGAAVVEIGATQANAVLALFHDHFPGVAPAVYRDLADHNRVVVCRTRAEE